MSENQNMKVIKAARTFFMETWFLMRY